MFDARIIRKAKRDYSAMLATVTPAFLEIAGTIVEADAKRLAPVDTGNLRGSINHRVRGNEATVGTNVEYAEHVEYGTRRMDAQPYLRPAIDQNRRSLIQRFVKMIRAAIRG